MPLFAMFLKLEGLRGLVVGAGRIAQPKIESLLLAGARVVVVAPRATSRVRELAGSKQIVWRKRNYISSDLSGIFLVIAATDSSSLQEKLYRLSLTLRVLWYFGVFSPPC